MARPLGDHADQAVQKIGAVGHMAQAFQIGQAALRIQHVDLVPGRQIKKIMVRHQSLATLGGGFIAQMRHHLSQAKQTVKIGPANPAAIIGQNIGGPIRSAHPVRRYPDDRKIRGATADIDDQDQLFARHRLFVLQGGGDRLELKRDVGKAMAARDVFQHRLRLGIARGVIIDKMHRAAQHHLAYRARNAVQRRDHPPKEPRHHVLERNRTVADAGFLVNQRRSQRRFQPPHQPSIIAAHIGCDGRTAKFRGRAIAFPEHCRGKGNIGLFQRDQPGTALVCQRHG